MILWDECKVCDGKGAGRVEAGPNKNNWFVCLACEGKGRVERPVGPVDDIEEESTRG